MVKSKNVVIESPLELAHLLLLVNILPTIPILHRFLRNIRLIGFIFRDQLNKFIILSNMGKELKTDCIERNLSTFPTHARINVHFILSLR